jgi:hypothetical protein
MGVSRLGDFDAARNSRPQGAVTDLSSLGLIYLATPYSKYPTGIEMAFRDASKIAARMMMAGAKVYSPIVHTHPMAIYGNVDPLDHSIWLPFDEAIMSVSDTLVIAMMPLWEGSFGIAHEAKIFRAAGKPVFYLNPETLEFTDEGA